MLSQHAGDAGQKIGVVREKRRGEELFRRLGADRHPVAVVVVELVLSDEIGVRASNVLDPLLHRIVVSLEEPLVAVAAIESPGNDDARVSPTGRAVRRHHESGRDVGKSTLLRLGVANVLEPLREERCHVDVEARRAREDLGVPHPAEPLVALRAIGRNRKEIPSLAPDDVLLELVEERARGLESTCLRSRRVDHHRGQRVESGLSRMSPDLGVAKPVEGEVRLEDFGASALGDVDVRRSSRPQIRGVEVPIGGEHLREADLDPCSRLGLDSEPGEPHEVLSEVEDVNSRRRLGAIRRGDLLDALDERRVLSHQLGLRRR